MNLFTHIRTCVMCVYFVVAVPFHKIRIYLPNTFQKTVNYNLLIFICKLIIVLIDRDSTLQRYAMHIIGPNLIMIK